MSRLSRKMVFWVALGLMSIGLCVCSHAPKVPKSKPMPKGTSFTGVWYSPQYKHMHLKQVGKRVEGIFLYKNGGRIEGKANGNILKFKWKEPGSKNRAQQDLKGKGYLKLVMKDGKPHLEGKWGYGDNRIGGGPWKAEYIRELEPSDPLTLDELEDN